MDMVVRILQNFGMYGFFLSLLVEIVYFLFYYHKRNTKEKMYKCDVYIKQTTPDDYKIIMHNGFLAMDAELREKQNENENDKSGSTAITAFVTPDHIIVANCGIICIDSVNHQEIQDACFLEEVQQYLLVQIINPTMFFSFSLLIIAIRERSY